MALDCHSWLMDNNRSRGVPGGQDWILCPAARGAIPVLAFQGHLRNFQDMKKNVNALLAFLLCAVSGTASAQSAPTIGDACRIELPGVTFTRALNGAASHYRVEAGKLVLASGTKTDFFRDPDGTLAINNAPVLLAAVDNSRPFTLTAKVTPTFRQTYDAGALYVYIRDDLWLKFAMEMDERRKTRMVTVRTIGTSDDNNHDVVAEHGVYMKITSDTRTIGFYYSLDNKGWQLVRLFRNEFPASIGLGVSAQSPLGDGNSATFEALSLTDRAVADFRLGN
jgi:regulation of enolase protein 1 (concanavalin A-like superfamily)